jgi:hypothetical protein
MGDKPDHLDTIADLEAKVLDLREAINKACKDLFTAANAEDWFKAGLVVGDLREAYRATE